MSWPFKSKIPQTLLKDAQDRAFITAICTSEIALVDGAVYRYGLKETEAKRMLYNGEEPKDPSYETVVTEEGEILMWNDWKDRNQ